jgi:hypothetical protein
LTLTELESSKRRARPANRVIDPSGLQQIERSGVIPPGVKALDPKGQGIQQDLFITVQFLQKGQVFKYSHIDNNGKEVWEKEATPVEQTYAFSNGNDRQFEAVVYAVITLKSKTGQEVRGLHLQQDVVNKWARLSDGDVEDLGTVEKDYSSADEAIPNWYYGGWWFRDRPKVKRDSNGRAQDLDSVYNAYFWQAHVFVEENPKIQMYWGFYVAANWKIKGAATNAIVTNKTFGPLAASMANPFLPAVKKNEGTVFRNWCSWLFVFRF